MDKQQITPLQNTQTPAAEPEVSQPPNEHKALNIFFLVLFIVACLADIAIIGLVIYLVVTAYAPHDPSDLNGLAFPLAIVAAVVFGGPAAIITFLLRRGYTKTKP
jgi:hypothetical protein